MGGRKFASPQLILDGLNHQSQNEFAVAYNYLWYFDNIGTSQRSGGWGVHIQQFSIYIENDLFAGSGRDRFRTSHASISYHDDLYNVSLNTQDRKSTRLNSSHVRISYAVFCLKKKNKKNKNFYY